MDLDELIDAETTRRKAAKTRSKIGMYPHRVEVVREVVKRLVERGVRLTLPSIRKVCTTKEPQREGEVEWPRRRAFAVYVENNYPKEYAWLVGRAG